VAEPATHTGTRFAPYLLPKLFDIIEEKGILHVDGRDFDNSRKKVEKIRE